MAAETDTLKRTPLHDAPRRRRCPARARSPAGRCRCSTPGIRDEHARRARARRRLRRLPHGRRSRRAARARCAAAARCSPTTSTRIAARRRPVLRAVPRGRRRARRPLHLPARRRPLPDGHQRRQPRRATSPGSQRTRPGTDATVTRPDRRLRDARRPGPAGARARRRARRRASCRARFTHRRGTVAGVPGVLVCGTGYTGEDGVELLIPPDGAPSPCGTRSSPPAPRPSASARATRCAWRPASTSTATTCREDRGPIEAGLGWCCKEATGFIGAEPSRAARERGHRREARPVRASPARASPARATRWSAAASSRRGTLSPTLGYGIGLAYLPADRTDPGHPVRDRRAREGRAPPKSAPSH